MHSSAEGGEGTFLSNLTGKQVKQAGRKGKKKKRAPPPLRPCCVVAAQVLFRVPSAKEGEDGGARVERKERGDSLKKKFLALAYVTQGITPHRRSSYLVRMRAHCIYCIPL